MTVVVLTSVYVIGPVLALCAVAVLGMTLRWIFADTSQRTSGRAAAAAGTGQRRRPEIDDYGLLRAAVYVDDFDTGQSVRALLAAARVRATVATGTDGLVRVLVFPDEYERARRLVSWAL